MSGAGKALVLTVDVPFPSKVAKAANPTPVPDDVKN